MAFTFGLLCGPSRAHALGQAWFLLAAAPQGSNPRLSICNSHPGDCSKAPAESQLQLSSDETQAGEAMELGLRAHYQPCFFFLIWRCKGMLPYSPRDVEIAGHRSSDHQCCAPPGNHDAKVSETICCHFLGMQIPLRSAAYPYQPFIQLVTGGRVIFCFPRI